MGSYGLTLRSTPGECPVKPTIVIGSTDADFSLFARHILRQTGFETLLTTSADEAIAAARTAGVRGVVIDGRVANSVYACESLKGDATTAGLKVIALVGANSARQYADFINAGADESFVRPISPDHLLRALHSLSSLSDASLERLSCGDIEMHVLARRVWRRGVELHLPRLEFAILLHLLKDPGRIYLRHELASAAWPAGVFVDPKTINVHIGRLRETLTTVAPTDPIRTVRGVGYGLVTTGWSGAPSNAS
ncbi:response regulator with CheY-like receiver domain and winged-helix DNA-binding domain [Rhizobium leguminosarum bv. viciae WSM1455]|nr:response regulator with CheY-like receiver domain and winged-helix DNA-binding domain [Rhizobium leguminosarum bv. viciae WSM1455]